MINKTIKNILTRVIILLLSISVLLQSQSICVYAEEIEEHQIMVSLGDSYSSGEGIEPFYGQYNDKSEKVKNPDWLAHRSKYSWPGMLTLPRNEGTMNDNKDEYWFFEAASGAVTDNFNCAFTKTYDKGKYEGIYNLNPQLTIFDELGDRKADYVTMTIGGNDVGFTDIITSCAVGSKILNFGGLTDKLNHTWDVFYKEGETKDRLTDAYMNVADKAGENAQIIVAGYPQLLDKNGNGFLISKSEAKAVNDSVSKFNNAIEEIVKAYQNSGMNISFVSVEDAFSGHEAYSDDPYINGIIFLVQSEDLKDKAPPSAYSIHPNAEGAKAYAKCVQEKINEIEGKKELENSNDGEKNLTENPEATDDEINAKAKHYSGMVLQPEDVVLKMFDALQEGDYELAAECLDPATEQQIDFWGGIASTLVGLFTGEDISWGQLVLEAAGATDVDLIECYSGNLVMESNVDIFSEWLPKIPGLRNLVCTESDVYVKYRYKYSDEYYIEEETCHVRRYEWSGWRIER
jgi:lysophospholipase L1-like esterase